MQRFHPGWPFLRIVYSPLPVLSWLPPAAHGALGPAVYVMPMHLLHQRQSRCPGAEATLCANP